MGVISTTKMTDYVKKKSAKLKRIKIRKNLIVSSVINHCVVSLLIFLIPKVIKITLLISSAKLHPKLLTP